MKYRINAGMGCELTFLYIQVYIIPQTPKQIPPELHDLNSKTVIANNVVAKVMQ